MSPDCKDRAHFSLASHKNMKILKLFMAGVLAMAFAGCGSDNGGEEPAPPAPVPSETVDYTAFKEFVNSCTAANDYCKGMTVSNTGIILNSVGGKKLSVARNDVPYLTVSATSDKWTVNGKGHSSQIPANVMNAAPAVAVGSDGNLTVDGVDMGVTAGTTLRCVINARKHIYFCFDDATLTWASEISGTYNPPLASGDKELNILFIGNSFTQDATQHLPGMLEASGISNVHMIRLFHGGYTLPEYLANFDKPNICAMRTYHPGYKEWNSNESLDDSPADALKAREWDIVVIQEHTGRKEGWEWPGTLKGALEGLIDRIHAAQPNHRPTVVYLMAQTYSNGSNVLKNSFSNNRTMMFATTTFVAKKVLEETCIDIVISTGAMLENLRTTSLNIDNGMQLTRDSYHMDYGIARYGAACTVFETLITPCTGKRVDECPYRYATSNTTSGNYSTPVTDANAPIAQKAAHAAVEKPFEVTELGNL